MNLMGSMALMFQILVLVLFLTSCMNLFIQWIRAVPQGASDSTYGWDNYFNHYIYQSGWTYNNRMIGNPLFTVGKNPGAGIMTVSYHKQ